MDATSDLDVSISSCLTNDDLPWTYSTAPEGMTGLARPDLSSEELAVRPYPGLTGIGRPVGRST